MQQTRYNLVRVALIAVAVSAMAGGCAAETEPAPGPQVEPLNPQPLPPVTDNGTEQPSKAGDPPPPAGGETAGSSGNTDPNAPHGSSTSSSSSGSTDAGGQ